MQGVAISTTVGNNATLELDFGGTAINTIVGSGGVLFGNGALAGSLLDNGVVSFDAVGNTSFTVSGSGTFEIDGGEAVVDAAGFPGPSRSRSQPCNWLVARLREATRLPSARTERWSWRAQG